MTVALSGNFMVITVQIAFGMEFDLSSNVFASNRFNLLPVQFCCLSCPSILRYPGQSLRNPCSATPVRVIVNNGCVANDFDKSRFVLNLGDNNAGKEIVSTPHIGQRDLFIYPIVNRVVFEPVAHARYFSILWSNNKPPVISIART